MSADKNNKPSVNAEGFMLCDKCNNDVNVKGGGIKNLQMHQTGAKCKANQVKHQKHKALEKTKAKFRSFFAPQASNVPPTALPPPHIHSTLIANIPQSSYPDASFVILHEAGCSEDTEVRNN